MTLIPTKNDQPESLRKTVVEVLQSRLAELADLRSLALTAHWNVKGIHFKPLHELFGELAEELNDPIDDVAERIVQLGGYAEGSSKAVAAATPLATYPKELTSGKETVTFLTQELAKVAASVRQGIATTAEDASSADLLTEVSRLLDKQLWFCESHLVND